MEEKITASSARTVALEVLIACEKRHAWSDSALSASIRRAELSGRDAALASRLCYGVQQNQLLLLYWLEQLCWVPVERLELPVRLILELGLYQLAFLDRVPAHAAVDESVKLARRWSKNPRSPGLVNGVLRSFLRQKDTIPAPESLSVRYSHPQWLVDLLRDEVPEGTLEALLQANNSQPATVIQVNPLKTDGGALACRLAGEGVTVEVHPFLTDCYELSETGDLSRLASFREGLFQVQDAAARLAVLAAGPRPGMAVLDACAAPGGKSFQAAMEMGDRGSILSCDLQAKKLSRIREGAERLGISCITARAMDGRVFQPELERNFDLVLADVPCSGLGIIRKKPDIRYKEPEPLERLPEIQRAILDNVSRYVAPGGTLLYSTCTVLRRENQEVVSAFLSGHPGFHLEGFTLPGVGECDGMQTLWPHLHGTDGFFMAKLRRET
ncbi:MAG: 16S rRNA (cytosine(967)-C(5))-methyltransferase RsmB [Clostridiales bacterium]|nr:16S rRNA (cytosine(967)-C(5))-methyltransferase RsmB [Clostridiales bacterium]